ncbi:MAG: S8 family serine peptidase [Bacteroidales bacterium]|nr:S8 family serine peptidase [Bacteroidales bacterium]
MMRGIISLLLVVIFSLDLFAQESPVLYQLFFKDKSQTEYSIDRPEEFLTFRAIERRQRYNIPITEDDLPIPSAYLKAIQDNGARIVIRSRWLNMVIIELPAQASLSRINALDFVKTVTRADELVKKHALPGNESDQEESKPFFIPEQSGIPVGEIPVKHSGFLEGFDYGASLNQIAMVNGVALHALGLTGKDIIIAVLDAGFRAVDTMAAFDSLWMNNRILGACDFVNWGGNVFEPGIHQHGMMVLSIMGGNLPGQLVGTAPHADYYLLRTEDGTAEYLMEEYYWVMGAEYADSVGADIINSSLGYTQFDNPADNHSYQDMDGNTTPITLGADKAVEKGILVCNSAGNSGSSTWKYIGAPADGDSVFTIGAVDPESKWATFSSLGPAYDGRVKPDIAAQGQQTIIASLWGGINGGNGTSFSCPVIAGMTACLWQDKRDFSNMQIMEAIQKSASQSSNPDDSLGYGIPDYLLAKNILDSIHIKINEIKIFPNPFDQYLQFWVNLPSSQQAELRIYDLCGKIVYIESMALFEGISKLSVETHIDEMGIYIVQLVTRERIYCAKALRSP